MMPRPIPPPSPITKTRSEIATWAICIPENINKDKNAPVELYHLPSDVGEATDVADKHPEHDKRAKNFFRDAHIPSEFWSFGPRKAKKKKPAA